MEFRSQERNYCELRHLRFIEIRYLILFVECAALTTASQSSMTICKYAVNMRHATGAITYAYRILSDSISIEQRSHTASWHCEYR